MFCDLKFCFITSPRKAIKFRVNDSTFVACKFLARSQRNNKKHFPSSTHTHQGRRVGKIYTHVGQAHITKIIMSTRYWSNSRGIFSFSFSRVGIAVWRRGNKYITDQHRLRGFHSFWWCCIYKTISLTV